MAKPLVCWNCSAPLSNVPRPISRHANCGACFEDLHCCRMCKHFHPNITGQCDEDRADPPIKKEVANFCDWYAPKTDAYQYTTGSKREDARSKLDTLFAEDGGDDADATEVSNREPTKEDEARGKLDALFGGDDEDVRSD